MNKEEIIIWTNPGCPYCKQIKEELDKNNIKYKNKDTGEHEDEWTHIGNLIGMFTVPTLFFKNTYFTAGRDFANPEHLINLINNYKESKFSIEVQTFEKIKTLNYGINTAFNNLANSINKIEKNYRELFEEEETKTK
tara:strand:- start:196 stop:606 length:411 start_codon:yes stop_codon:yes gene_type:complete